MKCIISIGEPWDFEGPDGKNIIKGCVLKKINNKCIVFRSNFIQHFYKESGHVFILSPRTEKFHFDLLFSKPQNIPINGGILKIKYTDDLSEQELKMNSVFVLIGGIREE